jgi:hypothetical protein
MAHTAPDRRIASIENIAVIISLTLIVWLQHIDPNGGQDWGQLSNFRNMGLKALRFYLVAAKLSRLVCSVCAADK